MRAFVTGGSGFLGQHLIRALRDEGYDVRALARSPHAEDVVKAAGAAASPGALGSYGSLLDGMDGCDVVFHAAGRIEMGYEVQETFRTNVRGTENVIAAAWEAGVPKLVHVSSESVLHGRGGTNIVDADETWRRPGSSLGVYSQTKKIAEEKVLEANRGDLATVVVRPRLIWGVGDATLLPGVVDAVRGGSFSWFDGGRYLTSTCHVSNACEGLIRAAQSGRGGEVYFLTDGAPIEFREFITGLLATQGMEPPTKSVPFWAASLAATATDAVWKTLRIKRSPTITRSIVHILGKTTTLDDSKARRELGYQGAKQRSDGLGEMRGAG